MSPLNRDKTEGFKDMMQVFLLDLVLLNAINLNLLQQTK
jgi:hypothetical protein